MDQSPGISPQASRKAAEVLPLLAKFPALRAAAPVLRVVAVAVRELLFRAARNWSPRTKESISGSTPPKYAISGVSLHSPVSKLLE
jgi:hypothetical protein